MGVKASSEEMHEMFAQFDTDGNGSLNYHELQARPWSRPWLRPGHVSVMSPVTSPVTVPDERPAWPAGVGPARSRAAPYESTIHTPRRMNRPDRQAPLGCYLATSSACGQLGDKLGLGAI